MSWLSTASSVNQPWKATATAQSSSNPVEKEPKKKRSSLDVRPWENSAARVAALQLWESAKKTDAPLRWVSQSTLSRELPWVSQSTIIRFIKDDIKSLGGIPMTLLPCGSLQPKNLVDAIVATVVSIAAVVGGVAMIVLSCGAATPGVIAGWGAAGGGMLGIGVSGTINAGKGIHDGSFRWEQWGIDVGFAGVTSFITFPICFMGGTAITGVLLQGTRLSIGAAKSVALAAGSLVGAGIHEGSCLIKCHVEGRDPEILELVLSAVGGMLEGGGGAYLAGRIHPANVVEVAKTSRLCRDIRILRGIHRGDHSGYGAEHMLSQHNGAEIIGVARNVKAFSKEMKKIIENGPIGFVRKGNGSKFAFIAPNTGKYFAIGLSDSSPHMLVQMNRVSKKEIKFFFGF